MKELDHEAIEKVIVRGPSYYMYGGQMNGFYC